MDKTWLIFVLAIGLLALYIIMQFRSEKKMKERIAASFGERPEPEDDIKHIAAYWKSREQNDAPVHYIDNTTWDDLDMDKVYQIIDSCQSTVGAQYLYAMLHEPSLDGDALAQREKLVEMLETDPKVRLNLQVYLYKLGRPPGSNLTGLCYEASTKRIKRPWLYNILALLPILCLGIVIINPGIGAAALAISVISNGVIYYRLNKRIETELAAVKYFSALLWCAGKIAGTHALDSHPVGQDIAECHKLFKKLGGKLSGLTQQRVSDLDFLNEYIRIIFLTNIRNYNRVISALDNNTQAVRRLFRSVGELDAMIAVMSYRKSLPYFCRPEFTDESIVTADGIVHPLIKKPVDNSFEMRRGCLISGSNASGKSTFTKAVAIAAILAQTVNTCTAQRFIMQRALVMTSMAVRDNVLAGESYFVTEIKSLRRIFDKLPQVFCLCFIDEILKGTNTAERIAASAATLKYLQSKDCLCMAATHDIELTRMLRDEYDNCHFRETITDEGIHFDYKLQEGPAKTRNAIRLLAHMGFDANITQRAQELAERFDAAGQWPDSV